MTWRVIAFVLCAALAVVSTLNGYGFGAVVGACVCALLFDRVVELLREAL